MEISDDERKLKTVKEELERHGDIEELATGMQERVKEFIVQFILSKIGRFTSMIARFVPMAVLGKIAAKISYKV